MVLINRFFLSVTVLLLIVSGSVSAAEPLRLTNAVFKEIAVKGPDGAIEKKMVPAAKVAPGTEVIYVITYKNLGTRPAERVVINNPLPAALDYVHGDSDGPVRLEVSVDRGEQYGDLASLTITNADGTSRPARATDVTQVRWVISGAVQPDEEGSVSFRARLK